MDYDGFLSEEDTKARLSSMFGPVLKLTHKHGTEKDDHFKHYNARMNGRDSDLFVSSSMMMCPPG